MLAKCTNPLCSTPFRYLEAGRLFRVETDPRDSLDRKTPEYFWLCRNCSATMTLRLDEWSGVRIVRFHEKRSAGADPVGFDLLDRHKGRVLNRVNFTGGRTRKRNRSGRGGQVHV